jgi:hypothetical protein
VNYCRKIATLKLIIPTAVLCIIETFIQLPSQGVLLTGVQVQKMAVGLQPGRGLGCGLVSRRVGIGFWGFPEWGMLGIRRVDQRLLLGIQEAHSEDILVVIFDVCWDRHVGVCIGMDAPRDILLRVLHIPQVRSLQNSQLRRPVHNPQIISLTIIRTNTLRHPLASPPVSRILIIESAVLLILLKV